MYIYENYVVSTTENGNFEVILNFGDEDSEATIRLNKSEVEKFVNENLRPEMVAIIIAIIKFARIFSCKVDENGRASKDITKLDTFKYRFDNVLNAFSFEYLEEKFNGLKYSDIVTMFDWDIPTIIDYLS